MREIEKTLRFYNVDVRQYEKRHMWRKVRFEPIAEKIKKMRAKEGVSNSSYVSIDGERLLMEIRTIEKDKVMGVLWRTAIDGLPVQELGGKFIPLGIAKDGGVAQACTFGLFENSYLVYTIDQRGPSVADFSVYISKVFKKKFKIDLYPAKRRTFDKMLPDIAAFTVLNVRPRFSSMGYIPKTIDSNSLMGIFRKLMERSGKPVEIKFIGGRHTESGDAFENEFADFLKKHLSDPERYSDFKILRGTALLQSGELRPIDIADNYLIEKRVKLKQDRNRCIDIADNMRKIISAHHEKKDELVRT